jgi:hypothetical protein
MSGPDCPGIWAHLGEHGSARPTNHENPSPPCGALNPNTTQTAEPRIPGMLAAPTAGLGRSSSKLPCSP